MKQPWTLWHKSLQYETVFKADWSTSLTIIVYLKWDRSHAVRLRQFQLFCSKAHHLIFPQRLECPWYQLGLQILIQSSQPYRSRWCLYMVHWFTPQQDFWYRNHWHFHILLRSHQHVKLLCPFCSQKGIRVHGFIVVERRLAIQALLSHELFHHERQGIPKT